MDTSNIEEALGLEEQEGELVIYTPVNEVVNSHPENRKPDIDDDYKFTREKFRNLVIKGNDALDNALKVAVESSHPRAFEVVADLIKVVGDTNKQLLDLHQSMDKMEGKSTESEGGQVTNNGLIITTTELQQMMKDVNSE